MSAPIAIANSVAHSSAQLIAVPLGIVVDWAFDAALGRFGEATGSQALKRHDGALTSSSQALLEAIEFGAQVVAGSFFTATVLRYLGSLGDEMQDPNGGSIFILAFFASQRRMQKRLQRLIGYVEMEWLQLRSAVDEKMKDWQRPHPAAEHVALRMGQNNSMDTRISQQMGILPPGTASF